MRYKNLKVYEKAAEKLKKAGSTGLTPAKLRSYVKPSTATASKLAWGIRVKLGENVVAVKEKGDRRIKRYKLIKKTKSTGFKSKARNKAKKVEAAVRKPAETVPATTEQVAA
jgi:hypothetical protein